MKKSGFNRAFAARRLAMGLCLWFFDSLFAVSGTGLRAQTTLIAIYRWALYTPGEFDLKILFVLGALSDIVATAPIGFHGFAYTVLYVFTRKQAKYARTSHQYVRWFVFLGFVILFDQFEYLQRLTIGQNVASAFPLVYGAIATFALYPAVFGFLQRHD